MAQGLCIWCRQPSEAAPPEHVIPEALGCPRHAVLVDGEVCAGCNHGFADVDQALEASLDVVKFVAGVRGKRGKAPTVSTRSNLRAGYRGGVPLVELNFGPGDIILPDGRRLKSPIGDPDAVHGELHVDRGRVTAKPRARVLHHPKCPRALHKIALESIALTLGRDAALDSRLDPVRAFARHGDGPSRQVLFIKPRGWGYLNQLWPPYRSPDGYVVVFMLCGIEVVVDCTPAQTSVPHLRALFASTYGDRGWSWIPLPEG